MTCTHQPEPIFIGVGSNSTLGLTVAMRQYRMDKAERLEAKPLPPASWDNSSLVAD